MLKYLQISAASLALAVFAVAPATVIVTADTAIAKSENGNGGNGNGGNRGNGGNAGKGKSGEKGKSGLAKGGGSGKGKSGMSKAEKSLNAFGQKVKSGFGLFDKSTKSSRSAKSSGVKVNRGIEKAFDHPSNLGAFNGAKNSSPNAKMAHIRNGNFNGPVGMAAAYALADAEYAVAADAYADAQATIEALGPLADAYDYVAGYEDAVANLEALDQQVTDGTLDPTSQEYMDAAAAADEATYNDALNTISDAEMAAADAGETVSEESVDAAIAEAAAVEEADRTALDDAEANLLGLYKGDEALLDEVDEDGVSNREKLLDSINLPTQQEIIDATAPDADAATTEEETADVVDEDDEVIEEG